MLPRVFIYLSVHLLYNIYKIWNLFEKTCHDSSISVFPVMLFWNKITPVWMVLCNFVKLAAGILKHLVLPKVLLSSPWLRGLGMKRIPSKENYRFTFYICSNFHFLLDLAMSCTNLALYFLTGTWIGVSYSNFKI